MIAILVFLGTLALLWLWLWLSPAHRLTYSRTLDSSDDASDRVLELPPVRMILAARNDVIETAFDFNSHFSGHRWRGFYSCA